MKKNKETKRKKPKTVGIDNSDIKIATVKKNLTVGTTTLEIAKMIRDNWYKFDCKYNETGCGDCKALGFCIQGGDCHKSKIDDYIAQHDHIVDKHEMAEPKPISFDDPVPEYVYIVYASVIRCYVVIGGFKKVIDKNLDGSIRETFTIYAVPMTEERGEWLDAKGCYRTLEEAVMVAKKLWSGK